VNIDGTLARSTPDVVSSGTNNASGESMADGSYQVQFDHDVSRCTYQATAGEALPFTPGPDDAITFGVAPFGEVGPNAVFLVEYDGILGMDWYSSGFHLLVIC
jgi:hypothetical protein